MNAVDAARAPIVRLLAALGVRPNHLTISGAVVAIGAGLAASEGALLIAGLVFLSGSMLDGLDGALARHTDAVTRAGAFLDSVLDRVGEAALLIGLSLYFAREADTTGVVVTAAALALSMLVSYTRARAEGLGLNRGGRILAPRPARVVLLSVGLIISQPFIAVAIVTALSIVSAAQRLIAGMGGEQTEEEQSR